MWKNFTLVTSGCEVAPLAASVLSNQKLFSEITERQTTPGSPHVDTETIFLRWCKTKSVEAAFTEIPAVDYPAYEKLREARSLIDMVLKTTRATDLGRAIIAKLKPGGFISPHSDEGLYADHYERFHVCLSADDGNEFTVADSPSLAEVAYCKPGELWWFNHKKKHWAFNGSKTDRLHLIVDAVAPAYRVERYAN